MGEPAVCVSATPASATVPECELDFCPPAERHIVARNEDGAPGLTCSNPGGCDSDLFESQDYEFASEDLYIVLSFEPQLANAHTNASFKANFKYLWLNVLFPPDPTDHSRFFEQTEALSGLEIFDSFAFQDGRLKASFHFDLDSVLQQVLLDHPDCVTNDIHNECYCRYSGFIIPVTVDLDLTVDG